MCTKSASRWWSANKRSSAPSAPPSRFLSNELHVKPNVNCLTEGVLKRVFLQMACLKRNKALSSVKRFMMCFMMCTRMRCVHPDGGLRTSGPEHRRRHPPGSSSQVSSPLLLTTHPYIGGAFKPEPCRGAFKGVLEAEREEWGVRGQG